MRVRTVALAGAVAFGASLMILAVSVDMNHAGLMRPLAHVQFEFGRTNLFIHSLLGYMEINYPTGWVIAANRTITRATEIWPKAPGPRRRARIT